MRISTAEHARAITMWDFSWLERRWPGAGYEDWDRVLGELSERGYDTVRIDAYPHLVASDATRAWTLRPQWNQQVWGAQSPITVQVLPQLTDFIAASACAGVAVALSSWFREDLDDTRMQLTTPEALARVWIATLEVVDDAGLLDHIAYVDLCNEFPMATWAPFLYGSTEAAMLPVAHPRINDWITESVELVRAAYPDLDYTYSFAENVVTASGAELGALDLFEPHLWMAGVGDYYARVGYDFERFDPIGYDNLVDRGRRIYLEDQQRYDTAIFDQIDAAAEWSRSAGPPLATTECWSIIDYKDWPGLDWDWVKDLNERALRRAASTGRWVALATSNFCGPQFVGMWRDLTYHQRLTDLIHSSPVEVSAPATTPDRRPRSAVR